MRAIDQINELDKTSKPPRWHWWLALALTMPLRLLILAFAIPIVLMDCIAEADFRPFFPHLKHVLVGTWEDTGGGVD